MVVRALHLAGENKGNGSEEIGEDFPAVRPLVPIYMLIIFGTGTQRTEPQRHSVSHSRRTTIIQEHTRTYTNTHKHMNTHMILISESDRPEKVEEIPFTGGRGDGVPGERVEGVVFSIRVSFSLSFSSVFIYCLGLTFSVLPSLFSISPFPPSLYFSLSLP